MKTDFIEKFNEIILCDILDTSDVISIAGVFGIKFNNLVDTSSKTEQRSMGMAIIFDVDSGDLFNKIIEITKLSHKDIVDIENQYDFFLEDIKVSKLPDLIKSKLK